MLQRKPLGQGIPHGRADDRLPGIGRQVDLLIGQIPARLWARQPALLPADEQPADEVAGHSFDRQSQTQRGLARGFFGDEVGQILPKVRPDAEAQPPLQAPQ
jgi:hypothetical protein